MNKGSTVGNHTTRVGKRGDRFIWFIVSFLEVNLWIKSKCLWTTLWFPKSNNRQTIKKKYLNSCVAFCLKIRYTSSNVVLKIYIEQLWTLLFMIRNLWKKYAAYCIIYKISSILYDGKVNGEGKWWRCKFSDWKTFQSLPSSLKLILNLLF